MPRFECYLHELNIKAREGIPNADKIDDLYLIAISNEHFEEDVNTKDGLVPMPYKAMDLDCFRAGWQQDLGEEDWDYQWGWDGTPDASVRIGMGSPSISQPVKMVFEWGKGHPKTEGIEPLPHVGHERDHRYCGFCWVERGGKPKDCPSRRLRAMAVATGPELEIHRHAVRLWHSKGAT